MSTQIQIPTNNEVKEDGLNLISKTAYSVGHVVNDITFSFLLI